MRKVIIAIFTCCTISSCVDFDDATQAVTVKIQVVMPDGFGAADVSGKTVTMTLGSQDITAQTDNEGIVTFQNIVPDNYDISTSWKMTGEEYAALTGGHVENSTYTVSGSLNSELLTLNSQLLTLTTTVQKDQSLLIGKVYYEGSKDMNNRNYLAGKLMVVLLLSLVLRGVL